MCHLHFNFPDGSRLEKAFTYEWRLWELDEVKAVLTEAGFAKVVVYFEELGDEEDEEDGEERASGDFVRDTMGEGPSYTDECDWYRAQIVAFK